MIRKKAALDDVKAMGRARFGPMFDVESISLDLIYKAERWKSPPSMMRKAKIRG